MDEHEVLRMLIDVDISGGAKEMDGRDFYLYLYLYLYIHRSILESLFNPMNHQMIEVVPFPVCLYIVVLDNLLFVYIVCQLHFSLHLRVTVNMDPPGRWFSSFVWAKVASVFGEYSSQQASQRYGSCIFFAYSN